MAACRDTEQPETRQTEAFLDSSLTPTPESTLFLEGSGKLQDQVVDFLEKEVGSDLKSLKIVGDLLERLREDNNILEGQVDGQFVFSWPCLNANCKSEFACETAS